MLGALGAAVLSLVVSYALYKFSKRQMSKNEELHKEINEMQKERIESLEKHLKDALEDSK